MNANNQVEIVAAGLLPCIKQAMESHPTSVDVQRYACRSFGRLAGNANNKQEMVRANVLNQLRRAATHPSCDVQTEARRALTNLGL